MRRHDLSESLAWHRLEDEDESADLAWTAPSWPGILTPDRRIAEGH
jgi:hypothetical protein